MGVCGDYKRVWEDPRGINCNDLCKGILNMISQAACLVKVYFDDSSEWTFCLRRVPSTQFLSRFIPSASLTEELMVKWFKSFEHYLQNVLGEENESYLKTLTSPLRFFTAQNLQQDLAHSEYENIHTKGLRFLLRLFGMALYSL